ncbi:hypothetical protein B566_EDAN018317 [Ephemera danica]|nr:hypothetical protein B566_EDAN018317 [Ephemera danica]
MARQLMSAPGEESQFELADDEIKVSQFMKVHRNTSELLKAVGHWGESHLALDEDHLRIECIQAAESAEEHGVTVESAVDGKLLEQDNVSRNLQVPRLRLGRGTVMRPAGLNVSQFMKVHRNTSELLKAVGHWGESHLALDEDHLRIECIQAAESRNLQVPRLRLGRGTVMRPAGLNVAPWAAGTELYVAASDGHVVVVFDKRNGRQLRQLASSEPPNNMLCPTGVAFCGARGEVYVSGS